MKLFVIAGVLALGSIAQASFELAIVTDALTGFHRFDANTGTYLGSFGAGQSSNVRASWGSSATGIFYALSNAGLRSWRYSTGEYLGVVNLSGTANYATNDVNGDFIHVGGTDTITRTRLAGTTATTVIAGASLRWITRMDDGKFYMGDSANGGRILRTTGTTISASVQVVASGLGTELPAQARNAVPHVRPGFSGLQNMIYTHNTSLIDTFYGFDQNFTYAFSGGYGVSNLTTRGGAARGHFGIYHVGAGTTSGMSTVVYYDDADPTGSRSFSSSAFANPTSLAVVLAPEPGTMIALGLGALGLLRRRRTKSSQ